MLRRALQLQRKGQKHFPPSFWKQLYLAAIAEGPDLRMAAKGVEKDQSPSPNMRKRSLHQLSSSVSRTLLGQGLLQAAQMTTSSKLPVRSEGPVCRPMSSLVMGLSPPHSVINVGDDQQEWLTLLHFIATHRPAHLQHEYTTIQIQVGDVLPIKSLPAMWETATMIVLGKYKQGDVWMEGAGNVPCPEVCRQDKHQLKDGYLIPSNNQFLALSPTSKYSIVPAKGERIVVTYIMLKSEHIASYQHVLLNKKNFPVPAFAYPVRKRLTEKGPDPYEEDMDMKELRLCADDTMDTKLTIPSRAPEVWEQHERDGHMPKFPDCPVCVQEHGSVVKHFSSSTNSLHTLHLDTEYWGDSSLDGKRYFLAAGLRVQHEDKIMLVPLSEEVFQLIDYIATCKQFQAFHGCLSWFQSTPYSERPGHRTCQSRLREAC